MLIKVLTNIAGRRLRKISLKVLILGCLGYFILPTDLIPDILAGVGYADDVAALGIAFNAISGLLSEAVKMKAQKNSRKWLGK